MGTLRWGRRLFRERARWGERGVVMVEVELAVLQSTAVDDDPWLAAGGDRNKVSAPSDASAPPGRSFPVRHHSRVNIPQVNSTAEHRQLALCTQRARMPAVLVCSFRLSETAAPRRCMAKTARDALAYLE